MKQFSEAQIKFYEEELLSEADVVLRFCVAVTLEREHSFRVVLKIFDRLTKNLDSLMALRGNELRSEVLRQSWQVLASDAYTTDRDATRSPLLRFLAALDVKQRAILVGGELFGLSADQLADFLETSADTIAEKSKSTRQSLVDHMLKALSSSAIEGTNSDAEENEQRAIGFFQVGLQSHALNEEERAKILDIVEDPVTRHTREAQKISEISRSEKRSNLMSIVGMIALLVVIIGVFAYYFMPKPKPQFKALDTLTHEALALMSDSSGRLDFPSHDPNEISGFISEAKLLDFSPSQKFPIASGWQPDGASIIDYEVAKIVVVQMTHVEKHDHIFYFNLKSDLEDLPKSDPIPLSGVNFYPYVAEDLNIVAWKTSDGVLGLLMGTRSAKELAQIAATTANSQMK